MATILQQQLAAINAKSTDQLNLKAQKTRHSQSLLFEPAEAGRQNFETIFQICYEGFAELCQLDRRFQAFSPNLFAETSVSVEREHMTAKENKELDIVIEQFFGLVSARLLLRPAQKAVEWTVRRWRVQEYNTNTILFAFLPYHSHDIFSTLLSILPKQIPTQFSFLRPYIPTLQCPPRHAIVSAAASNSPLLSSLSHFVLRIAKKKLQSSILVGFWISIFAQALNAKIDAAQSGRDEVRRQKSEDVLAATLPILQQTLASATSSPELFLAACMIMTILVTKLDLEDRVIDAFMESIVDIWNRDTCRDGLECLAILAEEKRELELPGKVVLALVQSPELEASLRSRTGNVRSDKLQLGLVLGCLDLVKSSDEDPHLELAISVLETSTLSSADELVLNKRIQRLLKAGHAQRDSLLQLLDLLSSSNHIESTTNEAIAEDVVMGDVVQDNEEVTLDFSMLGDLPPLPFKSFLQPRSAIDDPPIVNAYVSAFTKCASDADALDRFMAVPALQQDELLSTPEFLSFLACVWNDQTITASYREVALQRASQHLTQNTTQHQDLQALYPSSIVALADKSQAVRKASAELVLIICKSFHGSTDDAQSTIWAETTIYGTHSSEVHKLSFKEARSFLQDIIEPQLEDLVLDGTILRKSIVAKLNSDDIKTSLKTKLCNWLMSHAVLSSSQQVQRVLLSVLQAIGKIANDSRKQILVPQIEKLIQNRGSTLIAIEEAFLTLTHRSGAELEVLKQALTCSDSSIRIFAAKSSIKVFARCKEPEQTSLAQWIFDRTASETSSTSEGMVQIDASLLHELQLPTSVVSALISKALTKYSSNESERPSKRPRVSRSADDSKPVDTQKFSSFVNMITMCLELAEDTLSSQTQVSDTSSSINLVRSLFKVLNELHNWRMHTGSDLTYLQALTLSNMLVALNLVGSSSLKTFDRSSFRTDMIVETLRSTTSPQVHNSALLLISKIATFAPDLVLHSVMPLFTFMSSSTLRQADAYSAHVISMTVESIVPPLADSLKRNGRDLVAGTSDLTLSFVAAFEHIPGHRRVDTFTQLVKTLGPQEALYAILAMLTERYSDDVSLESTLLGMLSNFSEGIHMTAFTQYVDLIAEACRAKRKLADLILGFGEKNSAEASSSVTALLTGLASLFRTEDFREKVSHLMRDEESATLVREQYGVLLEKLINLPFLQGNVINFEEPSLTQAYGNAIEALLTVLPIEDFISSSASLMQAGSEQVRRKVFAALTARVNDSASGDAHSAGIFLETLPNCAIFLSMDQPVAVRQAALTCIDAISEKFGRRDRDAVAEAANAVSGSAVLGSDSIMLAAAAMLCLSSMLEVIGEAFLPLAGPALDKTLQYADDALKSSKLEWQTVDAAFTLVNSILDHEAWLLGNNHLDHAVVLASLAQEKQQDRSWPVKQFCSLVAKKIDMAVILASLSRLLSVINSQGAHALTTYVRMLHAVVNSNTKATITKNCQDLFALILQSFDCKPADAVEGSEAQLHTLMTQITLDMTLKLNDVTFRPFFTRLVDWAESAASVVADGMNVPRHMALYTFAQQFFGQLGSIVTGYASLLIDNAVAILASADISKTGGMTDLVILVLGTLAASFEHDQDAFWTTPLHFEKVTSPLVTLLAVSTRYDLDQIIKTIVELAASVSASPENLKQINTQLLTILRHKDASTRLAGVKCQRAVTERLTFDWLNLLPEMLPFVSELLEDDDERVEREVLQWVAEMEQVTGESLEGMLA